jgi:spermidine synthase
MERWIAETFHPDWRPTIRADKVLFEEKSEHQDIVIFENAFWGRVLILDGVFQLTTRDEFVYHEMIAHVPLISLERPRRVLIIGGGDGGVLREVLKHPSVERATLVEIDRNVIDTAAKYFPEIGKKAYADKRTNVVIADGRKFVSETDERYDAVLVDSSEPVGPSAVLHTKAFFADCKKLLKRGGILTTQSSLPFHTPKHLLATTKAFRQIFADATPYAFTQPCYFGGEFTAVWGSEDAALRRLPLATIARRTQRRGLKTRYWTPEIQLATFMLPGYIRAIADKAKH